MNIPVKKPEICRWLKCNLSTPPPLKLPTLTGGALNRDGT